MICVACREDHHGACRGGSWCDCQHQPPAAERDDAAATAPSGPGAEPAEPPVNWRRQG